MMKIRLAVGAAALAAGLLLAGCGPAVQPAAPLHAPAGTAPATTGVPTHLSTPSPAPAAPPSALVMTTPAPVPAPVAPAPAAPAPVPAPPAAIVPAPAPPAVQPVPQPPAPRPPAPARNDHDGDNNGGPDDGDGNK